MEAVISLFFVIVFPGLAVVGLAVLWLALLAWDLLCRLLPSLVSAAPALGQKSWRAAHRGAVGVPVNFSSDVGEGPGGKGVLMWCSWWLAEGALSEGCRGSEAGTLLDSPVNLGWPRALSAILRPH